MTAAADRDRLLASRSELAAARTLLASGLPDLAASHLDLAEHLLSPSPTPTLPLPGGGSLSSPSPSPSPLSPSPRRRLRRLNRTLRTHELTTAGLGPRARRLLPFAGLAITITFAATLAALHGLWHLRTGDRPWRATYWDNPALLGEPALVRHHPDVHLAWGAGSPGRDIRRDGFSARIESCLHLDAPIRAAFLLIAQDDARLHIDGAPVIDNSGEHRRRVRGAEIDLPAGTHHLRVGYRHLGGGASVTLLASIDGRPPSPLPADHLRAPGSEPGNPCP